MASPDLSIIINNIPLFLDGLGLTVLISAIAIPAAIILGVIIAFCRLSSSVWLNFLSIAYLEIVRNVPFLIQLFLIYYILPFYGVRFPAFVVGVITLSIYASSYFSEITRSAILSLPDGQLEAARAFGMSKLSAMRYIVFPQLPPYITPPIINQSSSLVKDTALLSTITVQELTMVTEKIQLQTYQFVEPLIFAAILYLAINMILIAILNLAKRKYSSLYAS